MYIIRLETTMTKFRIIVLVIAAALFIATLIFVAHIYLKSNNKNKMQWPPVIGNCPDYWTDVNGDGSKCVNVHKLGTCTMPGDTTYKTVEKTNITPGMNDSIDNLSYIDCANKCNSDKSCAGFAYDFAKNSCSTHTSITSQTSDASTDLYIKQPDDPLRGKNTRSKDFKTSQYTGVGGKCQKYTWAKNCGITWDGITTLSDSPCVSQTSSGVPPS